MIDSVEWLLRPVTYFARFLLWLAWELCTEIICWAIGWVVCRAFTFGKFPRVGLNEIESLDWTEALVVEIVGFATLLLVFYLLVGQI